MKGIVCRNLYPNPDYRMSGDEDVLIPEEQFKLCHQVMLDYGMQPADPTQDIQSEHEVPYGKPGSPIYIELHKCLFPPESTAYGDLNRFSKMFMIGQSSYPSMENRLSQWDIQTIYSI